jgi:hypothetical protein
MKRQWYTKYAADKSVTPTNYHFENKSIWYTSIRFILSMSVAWVYEKYDIGMRYHHEYFMRKIEIF